MSFIVTITFTLMNIHKSSWNTPTQLDKESEHRLAAIFYQPWADTRPYLYCARNQFGSSRSGVCDIENPSHASCHAMSNPHGMTPLLHSGIGALMHSAQQGPNYPQFLHHSWLCHYHSSKASPGCLSNSVIEYTTDLFYSILYFLPYLTCLFLSKVFHLYFPWHQLYPDVPNLYRLQILSKMQQQYRHLLTYKETMLWYEQVKRTVSQRIYSSLY